MADNDSPLKTDEHLVALRGMWEEMKVLGRKIDAVRTELSGGIDETNLRIDETNKRIEAVRVDLSTRIDETNERVDALRSEFSRVLTESQVRIATELLAVRQVLDAVTAILRERDADRAAIAKLTDRLDRIEERLPPG